MGLWELRYSQNKLKTKNNKSIEDMASGGSRKAASIEVLSLNLRIKGMLNSYWVQNFVYVTLKMIKSRIANIQGFFGVTFKYGGIYMNSLSETLSLLLCAKKLETKGMPRRELRLGYIESGLGQVAAMKLNT